MRADCATVRRRAPAARSVLAGFAGALCALAIVAGFTAPALAGRPFRGAILMDLHSGKTLFEIQADTPVAPASLAKVMSLFLTYDAVRAKKLKMGERVRIRREAATIGGSSMRLRAGERVRVRDLMLGAAVASGNDAITALALRLAGSQRAFARAMNAKARALGMRGTDFKNPSGLPAAGQRSTPRDMATLARAYIRTHPQAVALHGTRVLRHGGRTHYNTNTLLGVMPGVTGLKTGWTMASGYNIIATAQRGKKWLLAVVMGGKSRTARDNMAASMLRAGFASGGDPARIRKMLGYRAATPRKGRAATIRPRARSKL